MNQRLTLRIAVQCRKDLQEATKAKAEGGSGVAGDFWDWTEEQIRPFI